MKTNDYNINGYRVSLCLAAKGEDYYIVYRNSKLLSVCWSIDTLAKLIETDSETIKSEIQEQSYQRYIDLYKINKAEQHP